VPRTRQASASTDVPPFAQLIRSSSSSGISPQRSNCLTLSSCAALLQLGDDLQDVEEDLKRGSDTLFTRAARAGMPLDALVEQLLNFAAMAGAKMDALDVARETADRASWSPTLATEQNREDGAREVCGDTGLYLHKALLRMSWRSLILTAVGQADAFFTPAFLARMEPCSPFRFAFLRKRRDRLQGDHGLFERLFDIVLNSEDQNAAGLPLPELAASSVREAATVQA
jgi:hypothetical protein